MNPLTAIVAGVLCLACIDSALADRRDWPACRDVGNLDAVVPNIEACTRIIADGRELKINHAAAYNNRCALWTLHGQPQRALSDCDDAVRLDPKHPAAYATRGDAERTLGHFDRALADYTRAIDIDPAKAAYRVGRGHISFALGDFQAAAADFQQALEIAPDAGAMIHRFLARARSGENAAAAKELEANAGRLKSKAWPLAAIELLLGRRTPEVTLATVSGNGERCEAQYFVGQRHLLQKQIAQARDALKVAASTCPAGSVTHAAAVAELKRIGS